MEGRIMEKRILEYVHKMPTIRLRVFDWVYEGQLTPRPFTYLDFAIRYKEKYTLKDLT